MGPMGLLIPSLRSTTLLCKADIGQRQLSLGMDCKYLRDSLWGLHFPMDNSFPQCIAVPKSCLTEDNSIQQDIISSLLRT